MAENEEMDINRLWEEYRNKKPVRQGEFIGEENNRFYVAKNNEEVYELSALVYYVWLMSDGEHTVEEIADRMSRDINIEVNLIKEPLLIAISSLSKVELLKLI